MMKSNTKLGNFVFDTVVAPDLLTLALPFSFPFLTSVFSFTLTGFSVTTALTPVMF
jgi:hypothetical protein